MAITSSSGRFRVTSRYGRKALGMIFQTPLSLRDFEFKSGFTLGLGETRKEEKGEKCSRFAQDSSRLPCGFRRG
ncbi:hypothetical protein H5410_034794 [Solanum commersonii]|uniref:Uncharacterized protein n=1 Tax=Solanum commersonii TaxID=4109 RepID=A0A9J5YUH6_SOLCO|nr:hypothetical protein H5410_034794 [Solanum commersonii]